MSHRQATTATSFLTVRTKLIGFGLFAGLSLFAIISYTVGTLDQQKADSTVINIAGRQRMLTQKYTKEVYDELAWGSGAGTSNKTGELFGISLKALRDGGVTFKDLGMQEALDLPAAQDPDALATLAEVEQHWSALQQAVNELRKAEPETEAWEEMHAAVRELNITTLKTMNKAVGMLANESSNKIAAMVSTEWSLFAAAIAIGALFSYFLIRSITRPLAEVSKKVTGVAAGMLEQEPMVVKSKDEIGQLATLCNAMLGNLQDIGNKVNQVATGQFDVRFEAQSESDQLAGALNSMIHALESAGHERTETERRLAAERAEAERQQAAKMAEAERQQAAKMAEAERQQAAEKHATEQAAAREEQGRREAEALRERERMERERADADEFRKAVDQVLESVEIAASGDLTHKLDCDSKGAVGDIARGLDSLLTKLRSDFNAISTTTERLSTSSSSLRGVSTTMEETASKSAENATRVSSESSEVSAHIQTVASAAEEMSACIKEVAQRTSEAANLTGGAVETASSAGRIMKALGKNSEQIGEMVTIISGIARQTNLLALNANIEAARAGDAGRGFSVVANEVKELAHETEKATEEIARTVELIQADSLGAIDSISEINTVIDSINQLQGVVASAVEEQSATTDEIVRSVTDAARGSSEIATRNVDLAKASEMTKCGAQNALDSADAVSQAGAELAEMIAQYKC